MTGMESWQVASVSPYGFTLQIKFENQDLVGYNLYEYD